MSSEPRTDTLGSAATADPAATPRVVLDAFVTPGPALTLRAFLVLDHVRPGLVLAGLRAACAPVTHDAAPSEDFHHPASAGGSTSSTPSATNTLGPWIKPSTPRSPKPSASSPPWPSATAPRSPAPPSPNATSSPASNNPATSRPNHPNPPRPQILPSLRLLPLHLSVARHIPCHPKRNPYRCREDH